MSETHSTLTIARKAPGYAVKLLRRWLIRRYRGVQFRLLSDHRSFDRAAAIDRSRGADSILFLCWGNVCRSPFAERYLAARLADRGYDDVEVESAGLGRSEGRSSPAPAVETAGDYGVDISEHRSKLASAELVRESDLIFVMDYNNFHSVATSFPDAVEKMYFLGALTDDRSDRVIADPHGGVSIPTPLGDGTDRFDETYRSVSDAADVLADAILPGDRPGDTAGRGSAGSPDPGS